VWAAVAGLLAVPAGAAESNGSSVSFGSDLFAAGNRVRLTEQVLGDAFLAAHEVESTGSVGGDLLVAGTELQLSGKVGHNLFAAGRSVDLNGNVACNARVAGAQLHILPTARIGGGLSLAGNRIEFDGQSQGYLTAAGKTISIDGHVGGDANITGGDLDLGPQAVIDGTLTFRGPRAPTVAATARLLGGVRFIRQRERSAVSTSGAFRAGSWIWLVGWMIAGGIILALWPTFTRSVTGQAAARATLAGLIGLVVLVVTPIAIAFLLATLIGIPLALLLLALYLLILPLGYLAAAATIADRIATRDARPSIPTPRRVMLLMATLLALFLVARIPYLGPIIRFLLLLVGIGAIVIAAVSAVGPEKATTATPASRP
jgi:hypothetical protein